MARQTLSFRFAKVKQKLLFGLQKLIIRAALAPFNRLGVKRRLRGVKRQQKNAAHVCPWKWTHVDGDSDMERLQTIGHLL